MGFHTGEGTEKYEMQPRVDGEFLEIHRSKLELASCSYCGQPSIGCITHGVFFFRVRKDTIENTVSPEHPCL